MPSGAHLVSNISQVGSIARQETGLTASRNTSLPLLQHRYGAAHVQVSAALPLAFAQHNLPTASTNLLPMARRPERDRSLADRSSQASTVAGISLDTPRHVGYPTSHLVNAPTTSMSQKGHQNQPPVAELAHPSSYQSLRPHQRPSSCPLSDLRVASASSSASPLNNTLPSASAARRTPSKLPQIKPTAISPECYAALPKDKRQMIAQHNAAPNVASNLLGKSTSSRFRFICDCVFFTSLTGQQRLPCTLTHDVSFMNGMLVSCGGGGTPNNRPLACLISSFS